MADGKKHTNIAKKISRIISLMIVATEKWNKENLTFFLTSSCVAAVDAALGSDNE